MKIFEAQEAKLFNTYKNTKLKLLKTNIAKWFNKMCGSKHMKPNYINIKINGGGGGGEKNQKKREIPQKRGKKKRGGGGVGAEIIQH